MANKRIFPLSSRPVQHLLFWLIPYSTLFILQATAPGSDSYNWFEQLTVSFAVAAALAYSNIYLCRKYFFSNKHFYFLGISLLYAIYITVVYFTIVPNLSETPAGRPVKTFPMLFFFTLYFLVTLLISFVYWSLAIANRKNKELLAAQAQLQQFENDKNDAELKFLRSQINPHFLYNTLNYFYSKALPVSPELADSILLLSDIMRYSLQLKENEHGMALLSEEIDHISNMIKINQYRFNNRLQVKFLVTGRSNAVCITPLILITFAENAFKHAELSDPENPLVIRLDVALEAQKIFFSVYNKKKKGPKEPGTGIGLENAKRRLDFIYGENHELVIFDEAEFYKASLTLPVYQDLSL